MRISDWSSDVCSSDLLIRCRSLAAASGRSGELQAFVPAQAKRRNTVAIYTHVVVGTNDLEKARTFYDDVLGALGLKRVVDDSETASLMGAYVPELMVTKPGNGQLAPQANGGKPHRK